MKEKEKEIGIINLEGKVDITDPCYKRDVWCRINELEVVPGTYSCRIRRKTETDPDGEKYKVVSAISVYRDGNVPKEGEMERIGGIGVDSGMAGFFPRKPDYTRDEWDEFCDSVRGGGDAYILKDGFVSSTGHGDGFYPVFAKVGDSGRADALRIVCL